MTGMAFGIVKGHVRNQFRMRIVAGGAGDSFVGVVIALAVENAIRLKAYVLDPLDAHDLNLYPRAMAGSAELRLAFSVESSGIEDAVPAATSVFRAKLHCRNMLLAGTVASLAGDARRHPAEFQSAIDYRGRGVATEAVIDGG